MMAQSGRAAALNVIASGEGEGLIFIHGAGGNAAIWMHQFAAFSSSRRVLAFDLPGFGRSPAAPLETLAQSLASAPVAVLDGAGLDRADVISQSLGGWSGLRFALAYPERVRRLVLSCTMAGVAHGPALAAFAAARERMDERGPASLGLRDAFRAARPDMAYLYDQVSAFNPMMPAAFGAAVFSSDVLVPIDKLAEIRCPVLLIAGEHDPIWPPDALAGIAAAIPGARMTILPGAGHSPYFEQPDAFNAVVASFLAES